MSSCLRMLKSEGANCRRRSRISPEVVSKVEVLLPTPTSWRRMFQARLWRASVIYHSKAGPSPRLRNQKTTTIRRAVAPSSTTLGPREVKFFAGATKCWVRMNHFSSAGSNLCNCQSQHWPYDVESLLSFSSNTAGIWTLHQDFPKAGTYWLFVNGVSETLNKQKPTSATSSVRPMLFRGNHGTSFCENIRRSPGIFPVSLFLNTVVVSSSMLVCIPLADYGTNWYCRLSTWLISRDSDFLFSRNVVPYACFEWGSMLLSSESTSPEGLNLLEKSIDFPSHEFQTRLKFVVSERLRMFRRACENDLSSKASTTSALNLRRVSELLRTVQIQPK